ncbi:MAG: hypothetical protein ACFNQI_01500 [Eikenella corrodens]
MDKLQQFEVLLYGEMYTELVANSFEEFLEKAVFDKKWDFD